MRVSIVSVNYNGARDTIAMLDSLAKVDFACEIEVFIVDNGSSGDDAAAIAEAHDWVIVIPSSRNLGFAGGNNLALEYLSGDYILYLNNDTLAEDDFISALVDFMERNPLCGLASPKILYSEDRRVHYAGFSESSRSLRRIVATSHGEFGENLSKEPQKSPFAHGAAMISSRRVLESVGAMREDYFLYFEEMEYSLRVERAGFQVWYLPESTVLHKGSATIGGVNPLSIYYSVRNYLYLIKDNTKGLRRMLLVMDKLYLASSKSIVKYVLKGRFSLAGAHYRALFDFIRGRRGELK